MLDGILVTYACNQTLKCTSCNYPFVLAHILCFYLIVQVVTIKKICFNIAFMFRTYWPLISKNYRVATSLSKANFFKIWLFKQIVHNLHSTYRQIDHKLIIYSLRFLESHKMRPKVVFKHFLVFNVKAY